MQLLRNYSLVEAVNATAGYATHPVVHQWAYHCQDKQSEHEFGWVALAVVGWAVPSQSAENYPTMQHRLLRHTQVCYRWLVQSERTWGLVDSAQRELYFEKGEKNQTLLVAIYLMEDFYVGQGKLAEAESLCKRALQGMEALGPRHILTCKTVGDPGHVYMVQGKLAEAEDLYERALQGFGEVLDAIHPSTLQTVNNPGFLYAIQGKLSKAEQVYERALRGYEVALSEKGVRQYMPALNTLENIGDLQLRKPAAHPSSPPPRPRTFSSTSQAIHILSSS